VRSRRAPGEGSIVARPNGTFQGQIDLGIDPDTGKRIRRTVTGSTKREVTERLRDLKAAADGGVVSRVGTTKATVGEAIEAHQTRLDARVAAGTMKASTRAWWDSMLAHSEPLRDTRLSSLTQRDIEAWMVSLDGSGSKRRGAYLALAAALDTARRNGLTTKDPMRDLTAPNGKREAEPVHATSDDVDMLLSLADEPWRSMFTVLAYTGMRRGELLALRWEDVDLDARVVRVRDGKTARARRTIPMAPVVVETLEDMGPATGLIFTSPQGNAIDPRGFNRAFERFAPIEGLTPHSLRHGVATRLLEQGVSVHVVSAILGHSSTSVTTDLYAHSVSEMERAAMAAL
jgi:integrase